LRESLSEYYELWVCCCVGIILFSNNMTEAQPQTNIVSDGGGNNHDNNEHQVNIVGWTNICTGKRHIVCCKEDQPNVYGIQWRFSKLFNTRLEANEWLRAQKLLPEITNIEGWYNKHIDERYVVSCRDDLNHVCSKYWTKVCNFPTLNEATRWRDEHIPRDTSYPHPCDIVEDAISEDEERMAQSFHRDDYGYEYLKSHGDKSIRDSGDIDWNLYTTGPWRTELALRTGFRRYNQKSTDEWVRRAGPKG